VRTPVPAAWQEQPSRGYATPPQVRFTREKYEGVKQELIQRSSWFAKLENSAMLAEDALDKVGRPRIGLNFTLGPTQSYYQKYVDAKRELEDFKRVAHAVNSWVPLSSNGTSPAFSSLERMRRRGSNLQQGPMNLYSIQDVLAKKSQRGGGHSNLGTPNGETPARTSHEDAQPNEELQATGSGPESSSQPVAASIELLDDDDEADVPKDDKEKASWHLLNTKAQFPVWKSWRSSKDREIEALEEKLSRLRIQREEDEVRCQKEREASKKDEVIEALVPLTDEAEQTVEDAFYGGNRNEVLAFHKETNIEVTRNIIQCLLPGAWLNDEVINVYMELMKERETREPDKFLKCHFFNTFFYNKLFKDKRSYDYKSVRRWTTQKKIGYSLIDCDKILVPIHQDVHWCLAVINIRDQRFEYLDSLNGRDENVLRVLAKYIADEAKDKNNRILDASDWERVFPKDIPEQLNGCDCGMFMLKYADFHSRGGSLSFNQAHMEYFRKRTVYEILQNKAT
jgi:sentrin-specific protease 1